MIKPTLLTAAKSMLIAWAIIPSSVSGQFLPDFSQATFVPGAPIDNPFFPLSPGTVFVYQGENADQEMERIETVVTFDTKEILGVSATVIRDRAWLDNVLVEDTFDWYAQDTVGNVWYLGEYTTAFEYDVFGNLIGTSHDGSWEAGVDGALPGWRMKANPQIGDNYYQEYAVGIAEDAGQVLSLTESVSGPLGDFQNVLKILDSTALAPEILEHKLYAPGVGLVLVEEELDELGVPAFTLALVDIDEMDDDEIDDLDDEDRDDDHETDGDSDDDSDDEMDQDHDEDRDHHQDRHHDSDDEMDVDDDTDDDNEMNDDENGESAGGRARLALAQSRMSFGRVKDATKSSSKVAEEIVRLIDETGLIADSSSIDGNLGDYPIVAELIAAENSGMLGLSADAYVATNETLAATGLRAAAVPEPASWAIACSAFVLISAAQVVPRRRTMRWTSNLRC